MNRTVLELIDALHKISSEENSDLGSGGVPLVSEAEIRAIYEKARDILVEENNVQPISSPVVVAGDIHGQFEDLLELFKVGGSLPNTSYIFLGDFVDRGDNSVESFILLVLYKIAYPDRITLLRGNHESRSITQIYGFYDECMRKYGGANVWRMCTELFDFLALAAVSFSKQHISQVVDGRVFCVHGGLSPEVRMIDQIRLISRNREIPHTGSFAGSKIWYDDSSDILWSDPDPQVDTWAVNPRGAGWLFGAKVADDFCFVNDIELIARAHQLALEGYQYFFPEKNLVTVWSAPNYCKRCGNVGAIMMLSEDGKSTFETVNEVKRNKTKNR